MMYATNVAFIKVHYCHLLGLFTLIYTSRLDAIVKRSQVPVHFLLFIFQHNSPHTLPERSTELEELRLDKNRPLTLLWYLPRPL